MIAQVVENSNKNSNYKQKRLDNVEQDIDKIGTT